MRPLQFHRSRFCCAFLLLLLGGVNTVHAQSSGATFILQPVAPKTVPPSDYPPGTTIVGQEIILGSVPARVWLDIHVTGFPTTDSPDCAKSVVAKIDATDNDMDGNGFWGLYADCAGSPAIGAGDITHAWQACTPRCVGGANAGSPCTVIADCPGSTCSGNADCRNSMGGLTGPCFAHEACSGGFCSYAFMDRCDPEWICSGPVCFTSLSVHTMDTSYGVSLDLNSDDCLSDFGPSYLGTLVIQIPANAKGSYTLEFSVSETFLSNGNKNDIPIAAFIPAIITVPCGRCCYGVNTSSTGCVERVSAIECARNAPSAVFQADMDCPDSGGPACPVCALDEHCDDGLHCNGPEVCEDGGVCGPGDPPCESYEACEESTDSCAPRIPAVSNWGLIILILSLLVTAKLRYRRTTAEVINSLR